MNYIGTRAHVMNHSHGRCLACAFDKIQQEISIWTDHRDVISFILQKSIFLQFLYNDTRFYDKYVTSDDINKYIDDDGSGFF